MSQDTHIEEHSSPIKTPTQLIVVVVLAFVIPIAFFGMLAHFMVSLNLSDKSAMSDQEVAKRLKPVGDVAITDPNAPVVAKSGKEVVDAVCGACHTAGALNAPKIGDKAAWGKLAAQGLEKLTQSAIKGVKQMPPRGGNPDLSDLEIARAIVFMANQSGGSLKEPADKPAAAPAKGAAPAKAEKPAPAKGK
jgi:cytochrome c5